MFQKGIKITLISFCSVLIVLFIAAQIFFYCRDQREAPYETYVGLMEISFACERFREDRDRWPVSIAELIDFNGGLREAARDAWGNDVILVPYDQEGGFGEIKSYGRDGRPGGSGLSRDLVVRFPVDSNYAWNKQIARGIRGEAWKGYDWFDDFVLRAYWPKTNALMTNIDWGKP